MGSPMSKDESIRTRNTPHKQLKEKPKAKKVAQKANKEPGK